jgi:molybdopterin synthase sulfur carrier subunit
LASLAKVTVKFFATVREAVGIRSAEMEAQDIRELIDKLRHQFGRRFVNAVIDSESGELKRFYSCMVNGKRIDLLNGYDTELMDGDAVALFPPIGGG